MCTYKYITNGTIVYVSVQTYKLSWSMNSTILHLKQYLIVVFPHPAPIKKLSLWSKIQHEKFSVKIISWLIRFQDVTQIVLWKYNHMANSHETTIRASSPTEPSKKGGGHNREDAETPQGLSSLYTCHFPDPRHTGWTQAKFL